jgi:hypothetical protein
MTPEDLKAEGVSIKGKIAAEGMALSKLSAPIFGDVVDGSLTPARGAVIGEVSNHADQQALYKLIQDRERGGKRLTNDQIGELIRLNNRTATVAETQGGLFGEEETTRSLLPEKAEISDYVRKQLATEKKLFGAVSSQAAAERLGEAGSVIKAGENAETAQRANQGILLYDKLSSTAGPIDGILDRAAQQLANGENANDAKRQAYRAIRDTLAQQIRQLTGVPEGSLRGPEGHGGEGPRQTGSGQHDRAVAPLLLASPQLGAVNRTFLLCANRTLSFCGDTYLFTIALTRPILIRLEPAWPDERRFRMGDRSLDFSPIPPYQGQFCFAIKRKPEEYSHE